MGNRDAALLCGMFELDMATLLSHPDASPAMERAGKYRLADLLEAGTSLAYVASEVYQAMEAARDKKASPSSSPVLDRGRTCM